MEPLTTTYKQIGTLEITTDIYLPPPPSNGEPKSYPVLIMIHGGAFMLGHSGLINMSQVSECQTRNWIVVSPNHRLCPQVDILSGPIQDCRDLLSWIYDGQLDSVLVEKGLDQYRVDMEKVMAMGMSSGGLLALSLGYDVPRPVRAILDFYGAVHFTHPFWNEPLPHVAAILPPFTEEFLSEVYEEHPVPTASGISLEGPAGQSNRPDFSRPRDAFALSQIAQGTVLKACFPKGDIRSIDPVEKVEENFPATFIVHGDSDRMVPIDVSRALLGRLREKGVKCGMVEVPGEDHTFVLGMKEGSKTWEVQREGWEFLEGIISGN